MRKAISTVVTWLLPEAPASALGWYCQAKNGMYRCCEIGPGGTRICTGWKKGGCAGVNCWH